LAWGNIKIKRIKWDDRQVKIQLSSKNKQKVTLEIGNGIQLTNSKVNGAKYKIKDGKLMLYLSNDKIVEIVVSRLK